ncbi:hypothetical protein ACFQZO_17610 [Bradyrhizobium sp. GCM10027634]|uniref:Carbon-nitrogen hydrolase family protein n=2 Tax=Bradyrhizobium TaxID=374 RepID=A0A9X1RA99_9BRAD|nr:MULTISPECIES: hypothetical protein [Bradyrhizobium]GGI25663.1 hypothetical protein GCM10010987_35500 [Bradyrhizobium guangdongense]MCG2628271.1 hypothetical protein [Bradyrhizobium zhengyangense]MCG2643390.1 hypothetical protein [Bradyrhizobium zhengyangense]MCG2670296.1 hypothetical protein [Bradyrhizobium zhengyangense]MDN4985970.1 hypothetical protein [Bradyrhizobium sp. WYCCWR 13022]
MPGPADSRLKTTEFGKWKKAAGELAQSQASMTHARRDELRKALIELDKLFRKAPPSVYKAYRNLSERRLEESARSFGDSVGEGRLLWSVSEETPEQVAVSLGGLIRAIDRVLLERRSQWPIASGEWRLEALGCWFIPRQGVSAGRPARRSQAYSKRGLLFHRILPTFIDGYAVEVVDSRTLHSAAQDPTNWKMGACLFEALKLEAEFATVDGDKRFIVSGVDAPAAGNAVLLQMANALQENCIAIVWPELTVPPGLREKIVKFIRERDVADPLEPPEIVIPGTWHEVAGKEIVNRARIYDGYGEERLVYDKIAPYADDDWGIENITAGERMCVLATEGALIGVAICLDFCDVCDTPFRDLDVDVMLVPSMGNDRTMQGHQTTASQVEVKFGTRSFVVQHPTHNRYGDGRLGTILPLLKEPNAVSARELGQKTVWTAYKWGR